ncbi:MAG: DUF3060 domain-containing protein [Kofleriaceae bacterium]
MRTLLACVLLLGANVAAAEVSVVDNDKTMTIDCAKDPTVSLIGNNLNVTLVGPCKLVTVTGNSEQVKGSAEKFMIAGNKNTVTADSTDEIFVGGNKNSVAWKKAGLKPAPKITNTGKDNKVTQSK